MKRLLTVLLICAISAASCQKINTPLTYSVNLPGKKSAKPPVLIMLHGYGSNETDPLAMAKSFDPRFLGFCLRAPNPTKVGGFCWYEMEFLPDAQFRYNYEDVKKSREMILSFISNACKAYGADSTQVFLVGFSQGAIMCYELALYAPAKIKGAVALSGRVLEESKAREIDWAKATKVKYFIGHGYSDNVIKFWESEKANGYLKVMKVEDITFKGYEMPHAITGPELNDIKAWLARAIQPNKTGTK